MVYYYQVSENLSMIREELPEDTNPDKLSGYKLDDKEIILSKKRGPGFKFNNPSYFNLEQKTDACALYCVYGDVDQVSEMTGIDPKFLRQWKDEPWWSEIQKKVFVEQNEKLASRISGVLDRSLDHLVDRLDNGDYLWDVRKSKLVRKPVDTKVLSNLFNNLVTRRQLIRGEPTSITTQVAVDDRLKLLAQQFEKFANAKEIDAVPTTYQEIKNGNTNEKISTNEETNEENANEKG
jgi:hypothetical protein